jgi:DNA-binding transcriptional ArsR family regulator
MALRGTLSDFGIADIFQLVGHQTKTGILLLRNRDQDVRISFVEGNVVKAVKASRDRADLLGNIMVRARVLTNEQLDDALSIQQRTMRRLGDVLVEKRYVDLDTLRQFTRLQTTETIYRHVCGSRRRARARSHDLRKAASPLHDGPARFGAACASRPSAAKMRVA